jgi:UPF0271 protein
VKVDLNVDLGEQEDEDERLWQAATVVNVACGGHAGDAASMRRAVARAWRHQALVAAHPSYPDRAGFGRRSRYVEAVDAAIAVAKQCEELAGVARLEGVAVGVLKPHGALYHDVTVDLQLASRIVRSARAALPALAVVVGPPSSALEQATLTEGLVYAREGFADRAYDTAERLVPRSEPGALLADPRTCAEQAVRLARSGRYQTLCMHGDSPGAATLVEAVREALDAARLLVHPGEDD